MRGRATGLVVATVLTACVPGRCDEGPGPDCGVLALRQLLAVSGRAVELGEVRAGLPPPRPEGYSLAELRDAAADRGLRLRGVRIPPRGAPPSGPTLVHLDRGPHGHFAVIRPVGHSGRLVQVIDPTGEAEVTDWDRVRRRADWSGVALVPATSPIGPLAAGAAVAAMGMAAVWRWRRRPRVTQPGPLPAVAGQDLP